MDDAERSALTKRLRDAMGDVWEDAYCASWMNVPSEIEDVCRRALTTNAPAGYGWTEVTVGRAREIWAMAEQLGGWILEEGPEDRIVLVPFTPLGAVRDPSKAWPSEGWLPEDL